MFKILIKKSAALELIRLKSNVSKHFIAEVKKWVIDSEMHRSSAKLSYNWQTKKAVLLKTPL